MVGLRVKQAKQKKVVEPKPRTRSHAKRIGSTGGQFVISDELWALIGAAVGGTQEHASFRRRTALRPDRVCADGIFFVLRTGCQWNALSATSLCPSSTAHDRFQAWVEDGFFLRVWQAGLAEYDAFNGIDWSWLSMDGAMTKAPLAREKNRPQPRGPRQGGHQAILAGGSQRRASGPVRGRSQQKRLQNAG